jgi:hypothetical protein
MSLDAIFGSVEQSKCDAIRLKPLECHYTHVTEHNFVKECQRFCFRNQIRLILTCGLPTLKRDKMIQALHTKYGEAKCKVVSFTDSFYNANGEYNFCPETLTKSHKTCQGQVWTFLNDRSKYEMVVARNTFCEHEHILTYDKNVKSPFLVVRFESDAPIFQQFEGNAYNMNIGAFETLSERMSKLSITSDIYSNLAGVMTVKLASQGLTSENECGQSFDANDDTGWQL